MGIAMKLSDYLKANAAEYEVVNHSMSKVCGSAWKSIYRSSDLYPFQRNAASESA